MADFVAMTAHSGSEISKGIRQISCTRDVMTPDATSFHGSPQITLQTNTLPYMLYWKGSKSGGTHTQVPFFGTKVEGNRESNGTSTTGDKVFIDGSAVSYTAVDSSSGSDRNDSVIQSTTSDLGLHTGKIHHLDTGGSVRMGFATPIHTSSHYQTFETPFLHELVGGDRNMEQTNLVCSPDGRTWDELTRDTSYIGSVCVLANEDSSVTGTGVVVLKDWRGAEYTNRHYFNKDFAIAYDRIICLVDGFYNIVVKTSQTGGGAGLAGQIYINGVQNLYTWPTDNGATAHNELSVPLKRGDYVQVYGRWNGDAKYNNFMVTRVK